MNSVQTLRAANGAGSFPAEHCENLSLLPAGVSLQKTHRSSSPSSCPTPSSRKEERWSFYLAFNPGHEAGWRQSGIRDLHCNVLDCMCKIFRESWELSGPGHSRYSRGKGNLERLSGWPSVAHFTAKPILEPRSLDSHASVPATVPWPPNWIYDRTSIRGTRWGSWKFL